MRNIFIALVMAFGLAAITAAQEKSELLSLQQAIAGGLQHSPQHKAALAETRIAKADFKESRSFFFPRVDFAETATRSNDPVYVFGTRLRQGRFTAADFALNQLNSPKPIGNFATRFGAQWTVFDSFATLFTARRMKELRQASEEKLARSDQLIVFHVIKTYYAALFAQRQADLAEHAAATAQASADQSRSRMEAGTVVESDYLAAQVELAGRQQDLVRARNAVELSYAELDVAMGVSPNRQFQLTDEMVETAWPPLVLLEAESRALKQRSDLKEVAARVKAGDEGVKATRSAFGPRIAAFADSELDNVSLFGNGSNNWMAGAELRIELFSGGQKTAALSRARADLELNQALQQSAEDQVRLEVRRAFYDHDSARRTLEVSKAAVTQAEEGLRIVSNRYGAGMTTITDLLRAEDAARQARTNYWEAVYRCAVSYAALRLAGGDLTADSMNLRSPGVAQ